MLPQAARAKGINNNVIRLNLRIKTGKNNNTPSPKPKTVSKASPCCWIKDITDCTALVWKVVLVNAWVRVPLASIYWLDTRILPKILFQFSLEPSTVGTNTSCALGLLPDREPSRGKLPERALLAPSVIILSVPAAPRSPAVLSELI